MRVSLFNISRPDPLCIAAAGAGFLAGFNLTRNNASYSPVGGGTKGMLAAGKLLASGGYDTDFGHDAYQRLEKITRAAGPSVDLGYKPLVGSLQTFTFKTSSAIRFAVTRTTDALGRLGRVEGRDGANSLLYRRDYRYNDLNQRTRLIEDTGYFWDFGYDALGQVTASAKKQPGGAALPGFDFGYGFDSIGNRTYAMTNGRYDEYQADALNRYVARDVLGVVDVRGRANASAAVLVNDLPASRSADGGFYAAVVVENGAAPVAPAIKIQATNGGNAPLVATEPRSAFLPQTPESYEYDLDGNLTRDGRWTYTWDGENRLVGLEIRTDVAAALPGLTRQKLTFAYDARGRRIYKRVQTWNGSAYATNGDTRFLYDGWNLLAEYNGMNANALVRSYVWGPDLSGSLQGAGGVGGLLWATVASGSISPAPGNYAPAYDGNGNIVAWIDLADSSVDGKHDYGAFGEAVLATGPAASLPFAFSTKYRDAETELYYYGFRYYNPSTGRWLSRDPIGEKGGVNLYGMVGNDPIKWIDALGLKRSCVITIRMAHGVSSGEDSNRTHLENHPPGDYSKGDAVFYAGCGANIWNQQVAAANPGASFPMPSPENNPYDTETGPDGKPYDTRDGAQTYFLGRYGYDEAVKSIEARCDSCCKTVEIKVVCDGDMSSVGADIEKSSTMGKKNPCGKSRKYDCKKKEWSGDPIW